MRDNEKERKREGGGGRRGGRKKGEKKRTEGKKYDESGITECGRDNARHYSISIKYILTDSHRPLGIAVKKKFPPEYARMLLRDYEKSPMRM